MKDPIPTFEEVCSQYREFFHKNNGVDTEMLWVFREDVARIGDMLYIKDPVDPGNAMLADKLLELGRRRDLGLRIDTLCLLNSQPCCYVWMPADLQEAGERLLLMSKFIMSIRDKLTEAKPVRNAMKWKILKAFEGVLPAPEIDRHDLDSLPSRSELVKMIDSSAS